MFRFGGTEDKIKNISLENPKGKEYNKKKNTCNNSLYNFRHSVSNLP